MIQAFIEADSLAPSGVRLTTFVLKYPRFIHAELMTHRVFSRNASSSRAIPVAKIIENIAEDPAMPIHWGKNQAGMQAYEEHENPELGEKLWLKGLNEMIGIAEKMSKAGFHKQIVNRVLEPWSWIHVVVTATDFANFFALRNHHMAQPEIKKLAEEMWEAYQKSTPEERLPGVWHLPFVDDALYKKAIIKTGDYNATIALLLKCSTARCARVSYMNHDGTNPTIEDDLKLYDRLMGAHPLHASPAEHQAMAVGDPNVRSGNLKGWIQYRKCCQGENITEYSGG